MFIYIQIFTIDINNNSDNNFIRTIKLNKQVCRCNRNKEKHFKNKKENNNGNR